MNSLKVFAPASLSNLAVGFDILSLAIENLGDELIIKKGNKNGVVITSISGASGKLSKDNSLNTAGHAVVKYLEKLGEPDMPIEISLYKKMPIGSGMGSSAASAVAGVMAINELLGIPLSKKELLPIALQGERVLDPTLPADNVAASLLGGIIALNDKDGGLYKRLPTPRGLGLVILHPHITTITSQSRSKLRTEVSMDKHIRQSGSLAMFISSLYTSDFKSLSTSMQDHIIEEQRSLSIPYYNQLKEIAIKCGALAFNISGSGPTMFAFHNNSLVAENVRESLSVFMKEKKMGHDCYIASINHEGAVRL